MYNVTYVHPVDAHLVPPIITVYYLNVSQSVYQDITRIQVYLPAQLVRRPIVQYVTLHYHVQHVRVTIFSVVQG
jgi:hypothetical protein